MSANPECECETKTEPIRVTVMASELLREAGLVEALRVSPGLVVRRFAPGGRSEVVVTDLPRLVGETMGPLVPAHRLHGTATVAIVDETAEVDVQAAIDGGVAVVMHPYEASRSRLVASVHQASEMVSGRHATSRAELTRQFRRLHDVAAAAVGVRPVLSGREVVVLRNLAEGLDTGQVARTMHVSERQVKYILWSIMRRFSLHNRVHAVAFAIRAGLI